MPRLYTTLHGLCTMLTKQVLYDLSTDPTLSLHHWLPKHGESRPTSPCKCYDSPWTGLLTSGDDSCHWWTAVGVRVTPLGRCNNNRMTWERSCYAPSSILVFLHGCRGRHTCCPHVMLLFLVPVPGTFLLLSSFDIPLAIVPCNEVTPHCTPHGGPFPFLLIATPISIPQLVYKLQ